MPASIGMRAMNVVVAFGGGVTVSPVVARIPLSTWRRIGVTVTPVLTRQRVITPWIGDCAPLFCTTVQSTVQAGAVSGVPLSGLPMVVMAARAGAATVSVNAATSSTTHLMP